MQLDSAQVSGDGMFPVGDCVVAVPLPFDTLLKSGWVYLGGMVLLPVDVVSTLKLFPVHWWRKAHRESRLI